MPFNATSNSHSILIEEVEYLEQPEVVPRSASKTVQPDAIWRCAASLAPKAPLADGGKNDIRASQTGDTHLART